MRSCHGKSDGTREMKSVKMERAFDEKQAKIFEASI